MNIAVDTSAIVAFLEGENDALEILRCLRAADRKLMSSGTFLECGIVAGRHIRAAGLERLHTFVAGAGIEITSFDYHEALLGMEAYRRFGKGSGHLARLNFGDCFAYALAKARGLPLLFKGNDFTHTDIVPALRIG